VLSVTPNDAVTFRVCYEDEFLLVVGKPAGIVTLPGKGHESDTLLNGLFARCGKQLQKLGKERDFGLLHRLDKDTSGLLIAAKTIEAYDAMRAQFEGRSLAKFYYAGVSSKPPKDSGIINKPILEYEKPGPYGTSMKLAKIHGKGKPSRTAYRVVSTGTTATLLECRAITGRLHQVRVHLAAINCPIVGDSMYAPASVAKASKRLALHAHRLVFVHPLTKANLDVRAPLPKDMLGMLKRHRLVVPEVILAKKSDEAETQE
jgi:23S rRNA pseudouridine1911/1915/1917 synthase